MISSDLFDENYGNIAILTLKYLFAHIPGSRDLDEILAPSWLQNIWHRVGYEILAPSWLRNFGTELITIGTELVTN